MMFKISMLDAIRHLSANETLTDTSLQGLYKSKLQDSFQLQTVLALYDQETVRNGGDRVIQD